MGSVVVAKAERSFQQELLNASNLEDHSYRKISHSLLPGPDWDAVVLSLHRKWRNW